MALKIDYDTIKLQKIIYAVILGRHKDYAIEYVIKMTSKFFPFLSPSRSKILVAHLMGNDLHKSHFLSLQ